MKLTVKEYASKLGKSTQYIYQLIANNKLQIVVEDGKKYVVADDEEVQVDASKLDKNLQSSCQELLAIIESQQKQIEQLTDMLDRANRNKDDMFSKLMTFLALEQPKPKEDAPVPEEEVEEAEIEEGISKEEMEEYKYLKGKRKKKKLKKEEKIRYKYLKDKIK